MLSDEAELLQNEETRLLWDLASVNLEELSLELRKHVVISREVHESFASLDHDRLGTDVRIRYLLQHVYSTVKENVHYFNCFLDVVDKVGLSDLYKYLREVYDTWKFLDEVEASECLNESGKRTCKGLEEKELDEKRCRILAELLASGSQKWEEIGTSLGLPQHELKACSHKDTYPMKLCSVLSRWSEIKSGSVSPCTLKRLCVALKSELVGLPILAGSLVERFTQVLTKHVSCDSKRKKVYPITIVHQSLDVEVAVGKSTLLEVRVESSHDMHYQWKKNGEVLTEGQDYSGTNSSILLIKSVRPELKGRYTCSITSGREEKHSDDILLDMIRLYRDFVDFYVQWDELPRDSWPPVAATSFVKLALVTKSKSETSMLDYTVKGNIDDVLENKEVVEYEEVFKKYEKGTVLLVEGRPGSGKTTLMHKVTRDWAIKGNILLDAELVILVPLRLFSDRGENLKLVDIVEHYTHCPEKAGEIMSQIEINKGTKVCIILDGLDEYQYRDKKSNLIYRLLRKTFLQQSMVIVSSRPQGSAKLRRLNVVRMRIEVLGFSRDDVLNYLEKYDFKDERMATRLKKYLSNHSSVLNMCYLPVHTAMICYLYRVMGDNIPETETKVYETFTLQSIVRKLKRDDEDAEIYFDTLSDLKGRLKDDFEKICELAFIMTAKGRQAIDRKESQVSLSKDGSDDPTLGLVTIDAMAKLLNMEDFYTYLHLTFQEYLAAIHIANLEISEQNEVIVRYKDDPKFLVVWKFLCGKLNFSNRIDLLKSLLSSKIMDTLTKVICAYESQQVQPCSLILQSHSLSLKNCVFSCSDFHAISYVMTNTTNVLTKLIFNDCKLDEEGVNLLLTNLTDDIFMKISYLGFHKRNCTIPQFKLLNKLLTKLTALKSLNLDKTEMGVVGIAELIDHIELPSLHFLKIYMPIKQYVSKKLLNNYVALYKLAIACINVDEVHFSCTKSKNQPERAMQYFLKLYEIFEESVCWNPEHCMINNVTNHIRLVEVCNCSDIVLVNCGIDDKQVEKLMESLKSCKKIKTLKLDFNQISGIGANSIAAYLATHTTVEVFSAHCNQIDDSGALALARQFVNLNNPKVLDLQCNALTSHGVSMVTEVVPGRSGKHIELYLTIDAFKFSSSSSKYLNLNSLQSSVKMIHKGGTQEQLLALRCCRYVPEIHINSGNNSELNFVWSNDFVKYLSLGPKYCTNLMELNLDCIDKDSRNALAKSLKFCTKLQSLSISSSNINSEDAIALSESLKSCTHLQELNLSSNGIGSEGAVALSEALKSCTDLQKLDLSFNGIGTEGTVALGEALKICIDLQQLDLSSNDIGSEGAVALSKALKSCIGLQHLDVSSNSIGSDGAVALSEALKSCTDLHKLGLSSNGIGSDCAEALSETLKSFTDLQILDLSFNDLGSDSAVALSEALKCCTDLQKLELSSNDIGSEGAVALSVALKSCTDLRKLDLSSNGTRSGGAVALSEALKSCNNLQELYLSSNYIGSVGAVALSEALKSCTDLQKLNLSSNHIIMVSMDAVSLSEALKSCNNLQELYLSSNYICSVDAVTLSEALKTCTHLQKLDLSCNNIGSVGVVALSEALKSCTDLKKLDLSSNGLGSEGAVALGEALKGCFNLQKMAYLPMT